MRTVFPLAVLLLSSCAADPIKQLQRVAKDWSLTIRASQVIPVYPLSEDIQPGDVFVVPVSISEQTSIYEEKGFLPTDHLLTRLSGIAYNDFYNDSYWSADYAAVPHPRPTPEAEYVAAPRAAFPSYSFTVDRSAGMQLALPIQGIPIGLGLMNASRAAGTVTISDAHTYGVDSTAIYTALLAWYSNNDEIQNTLEAMASSTEADIFLRAITRVYLTKTLDVSLANIESRSGGADVGQARKIKLPDLSSSDPARVKKASEAYSLALEALSSPLNEDAATTRGGSVRIVHADRHTVSMKQTFDRPLVFGFAGFDVKVLDDGKLSAPIPSFAVLSGSVDSGDFASIPFADDSGLSDAYVEWLTDNDNNRKMMVEFLKKKGVTKDPADLAYNPALRSCLIEARKEYGF